MVLPPGLAGTHPMVDPGQLIVGEANAQSRRGCALPGFIGIA
jgi:hypothetical protein